MENKSNVQIGFFYNLHISDNLKNKKLGNINKSYYIQIMKNVTIYMGPMCVYCDAAKRLLAKKNIPYKEINIALIEGKMKEMIKKSNGKKTIPQIFIENYHIGGYEELSALENKGELDKLLK